MKLIRSPSERQYQDKNSSQMYSQMEAEFLSFYLNVCDRIMHSHITYYRKLKAFIIGTRSKNDDIISYEVSGVSP